MKLPGVHTGSTSPALFVAGGGGVAFRTSRCKCAASAAPLPIKKNLPGTQIPEEGFRVISFSRAKVCVWPVSMTKKLQQAYKDHHNELQKSLGHALCNVTSPRPLTPVNVDSMKHYKNFCLTAKGRTTPPAAITAPTPPQSLPKMQFTWP